MSDSNPDIDVDELIERNAGVDRDLLDRAQEAVATLRRAGLGRPAYRIDSPYERRPAQQPLAVADEEEHLDN